MAEQNWSVEQYQVNAAFVPAYGEDLLSWLEPHAGERILDLGCGDGSLTDKIRDSGAEVIGVDSSEAMIAAARARGLQVAVMNAEALTFSREFDAVFSNAAMHWMRHAHAVAEGVYNALKPGGRFAGEFGGHGCVAAIHTAVRAVLIHRGARVESPWYFPTAEEYREVLEEHGFTVDRILLFNRPTPLPTACAAGWPRSAAPCWMRSALQDTQRPLTKSRSFSRRCCAIRAVGGPQITCGFAFAPEKHSVLSRFRRYQCAIQPLRSSSSRFSAHSANASARVGHSRL